MDWKFDKSDAGFEEMKQKIGSVSEFLDCIQFKWSKWEEWLESVHLYPKEKLPWFRGVGKESYKLVPRIYRGKEEIRWEYNASEAVDMRAEFARRAKPFINRNLPYSVGEYLHLMQHYGFPTRLLDWTEGALIALYFAIRIPRNDKTPCVWMLNPSWLNYRNDVTIKNEETGEDKSLVLYTDSDAVEEFAPDTIIRDHYLDEHKLADLPIAVFPPHIDPRIVAQKSVFTIHGRLKNGFEVLLKKYAEEAQICKLMISSDQEKIRNIMKELNRLGMTETTLFPDLEGLSREIQAEYDMPLKSL
ncbi:MAG TPA: FRG domain-containing protein [Thermodesulfobacteriota bacterium]|nr:FRG domain-containing protein [Thermodesulfobacteriota bacterium]